MFPWAPQEEDLCPSAILGPRPHHSGTDGLADRPSSNIKSPLYCWGDFY